VNDRIGTLEGWCSSEDMDVFHVLSDQVAGR
jgi:hypothetical protein